MEEESVAVRGQVSERVRRRWGRHGEQRGWMHGVDRRAAARSGALGERPSWPYTPCFLFLGSGRVSGVSGVCSEDDVGILLTIGDRHYISTLDYRHSIDIFPRLSTLFTWRRCWRLSTPAHQHKSFRAIADSGAGAPPLNRSHSPPPSAMDCVAGSVTYLLHVMPAPG